MERLSAEEAAARLNPDDRLGPAARTRPAAAFMAALGERDDWSDLQVYGALLSVGTELFNRPGVSYLSGFFGPFERALRDADAAISFAPADFRRFAPLYEEKKPRVMCTVASSPDADGYCSLSLHAGGSIGEIMRVAEDPDRLLIVEAASGYPRTHGLPPQYPHRIHVDEIDILVESDAKPLELPRVGADRRRRRDRQARRRVHRRRIAPSRPASAPSPPRSPRCSPTARPRISASTRRCSRRASCACTSRAGHQPQGQLRRQVDRDVRARDQRALRMARRQRGRRLPPGRGRQLAGADRRQPQDDLDQRARWRSTSTARSSPTRSTPASTPGSAAPRTSPPAPASSSRTARSSASPPPSRSTASVHSRIVPWFDRGAVITVPRHQADVIITEHGAAELAGKTIHQRGLELAPDRPPRLPRRAGRGGRAGVEGQPAVLARLFPPRFRPWLAWGLTLPWFAFAIVRIFGLEGGGVAAQLLAFTPYVAFTAFVPIIGAAVMRVWPATAFATLAAVALLIAVVPRGFGGRPIRLGRPGRPCVSSRRT